jgi:hypothetical protein
MIADKLKNGKSILDTLLIPLIIVLVGVGAFGLGRLSALQEKQAGLVIHPAPVEAGD